MIKKGSLILLIVVLWCCALPTISAQELRCRVTVNSSQVSGTNRSVFESLETGLNELMNNRRWTDYAYSENERIDCNMVIIVKSYADEMMTAELQIQASRPVYGASYTTSLFNFRDEKFNFSFTEFDPIEINTSSYDYNLTAVLAYYAYVVIGLDLDSYSRQGGTECFKKAENIVNLSQTRSNDSETSGWKAFESDKNRYALINNLTDERFKKFRDFYYEYHRLGLDVMSQNVDNGRAKIASGISVLRDLKRLYPSAVLITTFLDAKNDELINMFSSKQALSAERKSVYEILTDVNPAATSRYEAINN